MFTAGPINLPSKEISNVNTFVFFTTSTGCIFVVLAYSVIPPEVLTEMP